MKLTIKELMLSERRCVQLLKHIRWVDGIIRCVYCKSEHVIPSGKREKHFHKYACHEYGISFIDKTGIIFSHSINKNNRLENIKKAELVSFLNSLNEERSSFQAPNNEILKSKIIVSERVSGNLVGIAGIKKKWNIPELFIVVISKFQGKGIGDKIMKKIGNTAKERYSYLMLKVLKSNKPAINLYRKHGFKLCGVGDDSYFMVLPLKKRGCLIFYILKVIFPLYRIYHKFKH